MMSNQQQNTIARIDALLGSLDRTGQELVLEHILSVMLKSYGFELAENINDFIHQEMKGREKYIEEKLSSLFADLTTEEKELAAIVVLKSIVWTCTNKQAAKNLLNFLIQKVLE